MKSESKTLSETGQNYGKEHYMVFCKDNGFEFGSKESLQQFIFLSWAMIAKLTTKLSRYEEYLEEQMQVMKFMDDHMRRTDISRGNCE